MTISNHLFPPNDRRPGLRPPQFGLRTLLLMVTACGLLCALSRWLPPLALAGIVLLGVSIAAHVAGNVLGTRLRANGDKPLHPRGSPGAPAGGRSWRNERPAFRPPPAPAPRLSERGTLGWPIVIATFAGLIAGGIGGGLWTAISMRGPIEPTAVSMGVVAFAALGAIGTFVTVGFSLVLAGAMWQALRHPASETARTSPEIVSDDGL